MYALTRKAPVELGERRSFAPPPSEPPRAATPAAISKLWTEGVRVSGTGVEVPLTDASLKLVALPVAINEPGGPAIEAVADAVAQLQLLAMAVAKARADGGLSVEGRARAIASAADAAIITVTTATSRMLAHEKAVDGRHDALISAPYPSEHPALIARATEIRRQLGEMSATDALAMVARAADEPNFGEVASAIAYSPLPMADALTKLVEEMWAQHQREAHPEEVVAIKRERDLIAWARMALAIIGASVLQHARTFAVVDPVERLLALRPDVSAADAWALNIAEAQLETARLRRRAGDVAKAMH